jgi:hypothetical protein
MFPSNRGQNMNESAFSAFPGRNVSLRFVARRPGQHDEALAGDRLLLTEFSTQCLLT